METVAQAWNDLLTAVQFLTRVPVSTRSFAPDSLARSVLYFPLVGLGIGAGAGAIDLWLAPHVGRWGAGMGALLFLVLVTGCLHEDALADAADGFGGGWTKEQILLIFKDSRIGSYGATTLVLSLLARFWLLSTIALGDMVRYAIAAEVLCRWTVLPLGYFLPAARVAEGQGARVAERTSRMSVGVGSVLTAGIVGVALGVRAVGPGAAVVLVVLATGWFYRRKIGGVTGDCFGATMQVAEIAVLVCGVWRP